MTSTSVDLWHKQFTSELPTSNGSAISLTLNTIETALLLNLAENASTSILDNILLSPFGSPLYICTMKSKHSEIALSDILSNVNRYKSSFEYVDFIQNNIQKLDQVILTLNKYISETKETATCILRDKKKLNIILLYKNYKSNDYILYEPRPRLQNKLNSPYFLFFKNDKLLSLYLEDIFCVADISNEFMVDFIRYKINNPIAKDIDYCSLCDDLKIIGVELKNENIIQSEPKEKTNGNVLFNEINDTIRQQMSQFGYNEDDILLTLKDLNARVTWDIDSMCLVYSKRRKNWYKAKVVIIKPNKKHVLCVKYLSHLDDDKKSHRKTVRFSKNIKPINVTKDYVCYYGIFIDFIAFEMRWSEDEMNIPHLLQLSKQFFSNGLFLTTFNDVVSCNGKDIRTCLYIKRINLLLAIYSKNINAIVKIKNEIKFKYDYINDYHHVLLYHSCKLEEIMEFMNENGVFCDATNIQECECLLRLYSNRLNDDYKYDDNGDYKHDDNEINYFRKRMDMIHSYILHSFDLNYRMKKDEEKEIEMKTDEEKEAIVRENIFDSKLQKFKPLKNKNTFIKDRNIKHKIGVNENGLGHPFKYWKEDRFEFWFVPAKYDNIKTELLSNKNKHISIEELTENLKEATQFKQSDVGKNLKGLSHLDDEISIDHILSVLVFTNYIEMANVLTSTFSKLLVNESNEALIKRNSEFHHWSKYLYETINCHMHHSVLFNRPDDGIWCVVNSDKLLFSHLECTFYSPTSATSSQYVAFNMMNDNGMILHLSSKPNDDTFKFFMCSLLSHFPAEHEYILFGDRYYEMKLVINSITLFHSSENYEWFIKAINAFNSICKCDAYGYYDRGNIIPDEYVTYSNAMINGQYSKYPDYTNKLFMNIAQQIEEIDFNIWKWIGSVFISDTQHNFVDFVKMIKLCNNVKQIEIYNYQMAGTTSNYKVLDTVLLDQTFLSYLFEALDDVAMCTWKNILIYSPNDSLMSISKFIQKYNEIDNDKKNNIKLQSVLKEYPRDINWKKKNIQTLCILNMNYTNNMNIFECIQEHKFDQFMKILKYEYNTNTHKHFHQFVNKKQENNGLNLLLFICFRLQYCDTLKYLQFLVTHYYDQININETDNNGNTPLMLSAHYNKSKCVELLVGINADLNVQNKEGDTVLHIAAVQGNVEIMQLLLLNLHKNPANPNILNDKNESAAFIACILHHSVEILDLLFTTKSYSNWINEEHSLFIACISGQIELVQTVFANNTKLDINKRPQRGDIQTPLLATCCVYSLLNDDKYLEIIKMLIENQDHVPKESSSKWGAKTENEKKWINFRDRPGRTVVWYAAASKGRKLLDLIIPYKPDLNAPRRRFELHTEHINYIYDNSVGYEEQIKYFIENKKQQNIRRKRWNDSFKYTSPLSIAYYTENIDVVNYLLSNGVEIIFDFEHIGLNVFHIAAGKANITLLKMIYEHLFKRYQSSYANEHLFKKRPLKPIVNSKEKQTGLTAFHLICQYQNDDSNLMLIDGFIKNYFHGFFVPKEIHKMIDLFYKEDSAMEALEYLVEVVKVDMSQKDNDGKTGLYYAKQYGSNERVSYLLNL